MKKICIFIPTMNRSECIDFYLNSKLDIAEQYNIDFYIIDTSTDMKTKSIVEEYMKKYSNLRYEYIDGYPDKTTDLKVVIGFQNIVNDYDYFWLCGDGCLVDIEKWIPLLENYMNVDLDMFQFTNSGTESSIKECNNILDFFEKYAWYTTYYCSTIISKSFVNINLLNELLNDFRNSGYLYWHYIFSNLALKENNNIVICNGAFYENNPFKLSNASYKPGRFFAFWVNNWSNAVEKLPDCYNEKKKTVIKSIGTKLNLYSIRNLIELKITDNLNPPIFKQYKNNFSKVTDQSLWLIQLIAYLPKWSIVILHKIIN